MALSRSSLFGIDVEGYVHRFPVVSHTRRKARLRQANFNVVGTCRLPRHQRANSGGTAIVFVSARGLPVARIGSQPPVAFGKGAAKEIAGPRADLRKPGRLDLLGKHLRQFFNLAFSNPPFLIEHLIPCSLDKSCHEQRDSNGKPQ